MVFLRKQPSVLPRILCASQCPPDHVLHDVLEFPLFYDALYYPQFHRALFESETLVCSWILNGLREHDRLCSSFCSSLSPFSDVIACDDRISYRNSVFNVKYKGVEVIVPLAYVETSRFSFCRLNRRLVSMTGVQCMPANDGDWSRDAESVRFRIPSWLVRDIDVYFPLLSALSSPQLYSVVQSLRVSCHRRKYNFMKVIVDDFVCERLQLSNIVGDREGSCVSFISQYFQSRYGDCVAAAFRDLRTSDEFKDVSLVVDLKCRQVYGEVWLSDSFDEMCSKISSFSKEITLRCLQSIPSHLRPAYNSRSIRSCRCSLLLHVRNRIASLARMSAEIFFETFFSVLPFWKDEVLSRPLLTESILLVEYGHLLISSLRTSAKSINIEKCHQQCYQRKEHVIMETTDRIQQISSTWPSVVPNDVVFSCLESYQSNLNLFLTSLPH
jgi:hypothetical protein